MCCWRGSRRHPKVDRRRRYDGDDTLKTRTLINLYTSPTLSTSPSFSSSLSSHPSIHPPHIYSHFISTHNFHTPSFLSSSSPVPLTTMTDDTVAHRPKDNPHGLRALANGYAKGRFLGEQSANPSTTGVAHATSLSATQDPTHLPTPHPGVSRHTAPHLMHRQPAKYNTGR